MSRGKILLVEDEPGLVLTLEDRLQREGFIVEAATTGETGLNHALDGTHALILLDVMLPQMDGFEVCRRLRARGVRAPILMLTARGTVEDRIAGLHLGADDYLVKPFDPGELLARIEALLRRTTPSDPTPTVRFGDVEVDRRGLVVLRRGREVELAAMELQLLLYFLDHAGVALSRDRILRDVWGYPMTPRTRTVDVHVAWLREKLEPDRKRPTYLRTIRGVGYKFVLEGVPDWRT